MAESFAVIDLGVNKCWRSSDEATAVRYAAAPATPPPAPSSRSHDGPTTARRSISC